MKHVGSVDQSKTDVESQLNLLLLLSSLMLAFSATITSGMNHDDYLAADQRSLDRILLSDPNFLEKDWALPSLKLIKSTQLASFVFVLCITLTASTYASLTAMSQVESDPLFFEKWFKYLKFSVLGSWALFVTGSCLYVDAARVHIYTSYPNYCLGLEHVYHGVSFDDVDQERLWNLTSQTMITNTIRHCPISELKYDPEGISLLVGRFYSNLMYAGLCVIVPGTILVTLQVIWEEKHPGECFISCRSNDPPSSELKVVPMKSPRVGEQESSSALEEWKPWLDKAGLKTSTMKVCLDDMVLFEALKEAGIPLNDRLRVINEVREIKGGAHMHAVVHDTKA